MDYLVLRCCERLGLTETEFYAGDYAAQLRWLAYELLRQQECSCEMHVAAAR